MNSIEQILASNSTYVYWRVPVQGQWHGGLVQDRGRAASPVRPYSVHPCACTRKALQRRITPWHATPCHALSRHIMPCPSKARATHNPPAHRWVLDNSGRATLFAYGQTGSGKTHTMTDCPPPFHPALLPFSDKPWCLIMRVGLATYVLIPCRCTCSAFHIWLPDLLSAWLAGWMAGGLAGYQPVRRASSGCWQRSSIAR